jgi:hypothetical protein
MILFATEEIQKPMVYLVARGKWGKGGEHLGMRRLNIEWRGKRGSGKREGSFARRGQAAERR